MDLFYVLIGFTQLLGKLEFAEVSARPEQHCHLRTSPLSWCENLHRLSDCFSSYLVGALIERPPGRARAQVVTNVVA